VHVRTCIGACCTVHEGCDACGGVTHAPCSSCMLHYACGLCSACGGDASRIMYYRASFTEWPPPAEILFGGVVLQKVVVCYHSIDAVHGIPWNASHVYLGSLNFKKPMKFVLSISGAVT